MVAYEIALKVRKGPQSIHTNSLSSREKVLSIEGEVVFQHLLGKNTAPTAYM